MNLVVALGKDNLDAEILRCCYQHSTKNEVRLIMKRTKNEDERRSIIRMLLSDRGLITAENCHSSYQKRATEQRLTT